MNEVINDTYAIPSSDEIIQLESYSPDELAYMMRDYNGLNFKTEKTFQQELDGVVHPSSDYSSADAHHQPHFTQAGDLEQSIRDMFVEYRPEKFKYEALDKGSSIYERNCFHAFNGCHAYNIFTFKLLTYFSRLLRFFRLEYFLFKCASNPLDILHLERYVYNGSDYWRMTENAEIKAKKESEE